MEYEDLDAPRVGGGRSQFLYKEMGQRGLFKTEPGEIGVSGKQIGTKYVGDLSPLIGDVDSHIKEKEGKRYAVDNLSLLSLIEAVLVGIIEQFPIDLLKIEILLILFHENEVIFPNKKHLMKRFDESPSIDKAMFFFLVLQSFLYITGKKLIVEQKRDYLINKSINGNLRLTPTEGFQEKFEYFSKMKEV